MNTTMKMLLVASALVGASSQANAAVVFDSQVLSTAAGQSFNNETRAAGSNYAAVLSFASDTLVNTIGAFSSVNGAQDIKFLIFDSLSNGGTGALLFSQTKSFASNGTQQFIYSDPLSFLFKAGRTYDVGILGSVGTLTGRWSAGRTLTANGISETSNNANFATYAAPMTVGYASVTPFIQLANEGAVPEPATWAMMILGMGAVGFAMRRRIKVSEVNFTNHVRAIAAS